MPGVGGVFHRYLLRVYCTMCPWFAAWKRLVMTSGLSMWMQANLWERLPVDIFSKPTQ